MSWYCEMLGRMEKGADGGGCLETARDSVVLLRRQRVYGSGELDFERVKKISEDMKRIRAGDTTAAVKER